MDPQATWEEFLGAVAANDLEEAELRAEALLDWLSRGGFPPQVFSRVLSDEWDRCVCQHTCRKVLLAAKNPGG